MNEQLIEILKTFDIKKNVEEGMTQKEWIHFLDELAKEIKQVNQLPSLTGEYDLRAITTENWQKYQDKFDDLWAELPPELSLKVAEIVELHKALESVSNI